MSEETARARILRTLEDAHPKPLDNIRASDFGLPDLAALVAVFDGLRADGLADYRMANLSGYDRVREAWLLT